ncbi:MAG: hypothetical protein RLZZ26_464, partial [Candidatus Parcubacteria bacterium]
EFDFIAVKSESGVGDQPFDAETRRGARNRLAFVKKHSPDADFWIAQEGGIEREGVVLMNRAWIVAEDRSGCVTESATPTFRIPTPMVEMINEGVELGVAADKFFSTEDTGSSKGAVGLLTDGLISRADYYLQAAIIALSEIKHKDWY